MDRTKSKRLVLLVGISSISIILLFMILNPFMESPKPTNTNPTETGIGQISLYDPLLLKERSKGRVVARLYGGELLELPLIDPTYEPYQKYLALLMSYIPSLGYNYLVTYIDLDGNPVFLGGSASPGYGIKVRFDLESLKIYNIGHGIEIIVSEVDNLGRKALIIHSRLYNLSQWAALISMVKGIEAYQGKSLDPKFAGWAIWAFNIRVNKSIYVNGDVENLSNIIIILEQPIYYSTINYWNVESEILFWSFVARPAFSLAFNIAIEDYIELKYLYKEYVSYFSEELNIVRPPNNVIDGLYGCFTPLRLVNTGDTTDCPSKALGQSIFHAYALGYPIGIIDDADTLVPSNPGNILIIPSTISDRDGRPFFTIDLNGDLIPERYIELLQTRYTLEDVGRVDRFIKFNIYLLNPNIPLYPYENKFQYAAIIDVLGMNQYFNGLPKMFRPPWSPAVETLFTDDPMYKINFSIFGEEFAKAKVIGPILREQYFKYFINQDAFHLKPNRDIYLKIMGETSPPPYHTLFEKMEKLTTVEWMCETTCRMDDQGWESELIIPAMEDRVVFNFQMVQMNWDILWKARHFDTSGFKGYSYALMFKGVYEGEKLRITYDLKLEFPKLIAKIKLSYNGTIPQHYENDSIFPLFTYGIPPNPIGNTSSHNIPSFLPIYLDTVILLKSPKKNEHLLFPKEEMIHIEYLNSTGEDGNITVINYMAIFNFYDAAIAEIEVPTYEIIFITDFFHGSTEIAVIIEFPSLEF